MLVNNPFNKAHYFLGVNGGIGQLGPGLKAPKKEGIVFQPSIFRCYAAMFLLVSGNDEN